MPPSRTRRPSVRAEVQSSRRKLATPIEKQMGLSRAGSTNATDEGKALTQRQRLQQPGHKEYNFAKMAATNKEL